MRISSEIAEAWRARVSSTLRASPTLGASIFLWLSAPPLSPMSSIYQLGDRGVKGQRTSEVIGDEVFKFDRNSAGSNISSAGSANWMLPIGKVSLYRLICSWRETGLITWEAGPSAQLHFAQHLVDPSTGRKTWNSHTPHTHHTPSTRKNIRHTNTPHSGHPRKRKQDLEWHPNSLSTNNPRHCARKAPLLYVDVSHGLGLTEIDDKVCTVTSGALLGRSFYSCVRHPSSSN